MLPCSGGPVSSVGEMAFYGEGLLKSLRAENLFVYTTTVNSSDQFQKAKESIKVILQFVTVSMQKTSEGLS